MTRLITNVGEGGLEPPRPEGHWHLKPARLPFRHSPETTGGAYHAGNPGNQPYWEHPRNAKTARHRPLTCADAILTVPLVPHCQTWPIPCI